MAGNTHSWGKLVRESSLRSYLRVAAVAAVLCTAVIEAFNFHTTTPPIELGAGVFSGLLLAAAGKALHII